MAAARFPLITEGHVVMLLEASAWMGETPADLLARVLDEFCLAYLRRRYAGILLEATQ